MEGSDTITPVLFQSYDFQASFPVKLSNTNFSDFCPVSSFWAWQKCCLLAQQRAVLGQRIVCNWKIMGDGQWAHLTMSSDSTQ